MLPRHQLRHQLCYLPEPFEVQVTIGQPGIKIMTDYKINSGNKRYCPSIRGKNLKCPYLLVNHITGLEQRVS